MTFSPPKKASKVQTGKRHGKWQLLKAKKLKDLVSLQYDEAGNAIGLSHFASPVTGMYNGRKIYDVAKPSRVTKVRA
jgi:ribosomal protein L32